MVDALNKWMYWTSWEKQKPPKIKKKTEGGLAGFFNLVAFRSEGLYFNTIFNPSNGSLHTAREFSHAD